MTLLKNMKKFLAVPLIALFIASTLSIGAYALTEFTLSSQITGGISVGLTDSLGADLSSLTLSSTAIDFNPETSQTVNADMASADGYVTVMNTTDIASDWTLSIAPSDGATAVWSNGSNSTIDVNDADTGEDGIDADSVGGRLTIDMTDASVASMSSGNTTGITAGSTASFVQGVTDTVTLMSGGGTASAPAAWGVTGITFTQVIPQAQPAGTYTLDLTVSVI